MPKPGTQSDIKLINSLINSTNMQTRDKQAQCMRTGLFSEWKMTLR